MISEQREKEHAVIGIFDSGVGGFSVLREVRDVTTADIYYFGDCKRAPYGNRKKEEIIEFIKEILIDLKSKGVTHFISACNSMSVMTTDLILKECDIPSERYIDMLRACIRHLVLPQNSSVLLVGTQATVDSNAYQESLREKGVTVNEYVFRDLAKAIEDESTHDILYEVIQPCLLHAREIKATHILYGCTHYPLVKNIFEECADGVGWSGTFIDPAVFVRKEVEGWRVGGERKTTFEASLETEVFAKMAGKYSGIIR